MRVLKKAILKIFKSWKIVWNLLVFDLYRIIITSREFLKILNKQQMGQETIRLC